MKEILFVLVVVLSITSLSIGFLISEIMSSREPMAAQSLRTDDPPPIPSDFYLSSFDKIVKDISQDRVYDEEKYNCQNFSNSLRDRLSEEGYDAKVCYGNIKNCDKIFCAHAWVKVEEVYIEATTGRIISPLDYEEDYWERICG